LSNAERRTSAESSFNKESAVIGAKRSRIWIF
jgi:hypothetical protein